MIVNLRSWLLLALVGMGFASGKSYRLERVEQDVYLQSSGLVRVVDTRSFVFEGTYREVYFNIDPHSGGGVRFEKAESLDSRPVVYSVDGNRLSITAGKPDNQGNLPPLATDEARTFRFSYTLSKELDVAPDATLFDRQVLEPVHAPINSYILRLHTPQPVPERFRVFIFTGQARIGTLEFDPAKQVATVRLAPVSENEFVRSRVILASRVFNSQTLSSPHFEKWLKETEDQTKSFREQSRRALEPTPAWVGWLGILPVGLLLMMFSKVLKAYWQGGREPAVEDVGRYYREPAEAIPPGLVPYVLHQQDPRWGKLGIAFSATLLEFARKGNLEFVRQRESSLFGVFGKEETRFRLKEVPKDTGPFEQRVYSILQSADNGDGTISPDELKKYFQSSTTLASQLAQIPREEYEKKHGELIDPASNRQGKAWSLGLTIGGVLLLVAAFLTVPVGIGLFGKVENPVLWSIASLVVLAAALGFSGLGMLILAITAYRSLPRWQPDKLLNARRWAAYRNFLADFSQMEQAPPEHFKLWDYHFVYAAALGVAERYLQNLRNLAQTRGRDIVIPGWVGANTGNLNRSMATVNDIAQMTQSLEQISRNLSNLESALSPKSSGSGGGFGGGFSGGSGGGSSSGAR